MVTLTEKLIRTADAYCTHVGRSRSRISAIIFGDGMRLDGVAAGKDIRTRSYEHAMRWFSSNWPALLAWPEGIERPKVEEVGPRQGAPTREGAAA